MTSPIQFQANDWLVFIDGVQVPFISFNYNVGVEIVPEGLLRLEPDSIITQLRPNAVISIFFRDNYSKSVDPAQPDLPIEDRYVYFGGGEVTSVQVTKQANSKTTDLTFTNELGILAQHKAVVSGIGRGFTSIITSGTLVINPFEIQTKDMFDIATLNVTKPADDDSNYSYSKNILGAVAWLSSVNASLRNRINQHRLLSKFVSIDSNLTRQLISRKIAEAQKSDQQDALSEDSTVLDIIRQLNAVPGYRMVTLSAPPEVSYVNNLDTFQALHNGVVYPLNNDNDEKYQNQFFSRNWARHDTCLMPNMYFAPPPPCNIILPDTTQGILYSRTFLSEPTRVVYQDSLDGELSLMFVSTDKIPGLDKTTSPMEFWGAVEQMYLASFDVDIPYKTDSPYTRKLKGTVGAADAGIDDILNLKPFDTVNLLDAVSDNELAKGIVTQFMERDSEFMVALTAATFTKDNAVAKIREALEKIKSNGNMFGLDLGGLGITKSGKPNESDRYVAYVQAWLDYKHDLARFNRSATITVKGHRWLAPGFPGVVFDKDVSLTFVVDSVQYTIDSNGDETTSVTVSSARPIREVPPELLSSASKLVNDVKKLRGLIDKEIQSVYAKERVSLESLFSALRQTAEKLKQLLFDATNENPLNEELFLSVKAGTGGGKNLSQFKDNLRNTAQLFSEVPSNSALAAQLSSFLSQVDVIVTLGQNIFDKTLGATRDTAGAISMQRHPDLAKQFLKLAEDGISTDDAPSLGPIVDEMLRFCEELVRVIYEVLAAQEAQALAGEPAFTAPTTEQELSRVLVTEGQDLRDSEMALRDLLRRIENLYDIPMPPSFFPQNLWRPTELDKTYNQLLGTKPNFYKNLFNKYGIKSDSSYLEEYQAAFKVLSYVYDTEWAMEMLNPDGGSLPWQDETLLRRGHQTLRQYLKTHGFDTKLLVNISSEPSPTYFYQMNPIVTSTTPVYDPDGKKTPFSWDDSVICRLVDTTVTTQSMMFARVTDPLDVTQYVEKLVGNEEPDPLVEARRKSARDPSLCGAFRQQQIINYSRRHMGARAYRGD